MNVFDKNKTFILVFIALVAQLAFMFQHPEIAGTVLASLPLTLATYAGSSLGTKVSAHWAASKDGSADTQAVIESVSGIDNSVKK